MSLPASPRLFLLGFFALLLCTAFLDLPACAQTSSRDASLQMVVILSRHGVRSPLSAGADLDKFSAAPWPKWEVAPGILTAHGYELMKIFGDLGSRKVFR